MLPLVSTMPLHNLHFLLSESIYRQQHVCSNLVTLKDLQGVSGQFQRLLPSSGAEVRLVTPHLFDIVLNKFNKTKMLRMLFNKVRAT